MKNNLFHIATIILVYTSYVNGTWSEWSAWDTCPQTCGNGTQARNRTCNNPAPLNNGTECKTKQGEKSHNETELRSCYLRGCPVNGTWGNWSAWDTCSQTCGNGTQARNRTCNNPPPLNNGTECKTKQGEKSHNETELRSCYLRGCPVNGTWGNWSAWDTCSQTCGNGTQARNRTCNNPPPLNNGTECKTKQGEKSHNETELRSCYLRGCPVNGTWGNWSAWDTCSQTCGNGTQARNRTCNNPPPLNNGTECITKQGEKSHNETELRSCYLRGCPVNGTWGNWSAWDTCSQTCGNGTQARNRTCNNPPPLNNGTECKTKQGEKSHNETELRSCYLRGCPVNGTWGNWSAWDTCSQTCGNGTQARNRTCNNPPPLNNGTECITKQGEKSHNETELRSCYLRGCPVNGTWGNWSAWDTCSQTCGNGTQARNRTCNNPPPLNNGTECITKKGEKSHNETELQSCDLRRCPVTCNNPTIDKEVVSTNDSIKITWEKSIFNPPTERRPYTVHIEGLSMESCLHKSQANSFVQNDTIVNKEELTVYNLKPYHCYGYRVECNSEERHGFPVPDLKTIVTKNGVPPPLEKLNYVRPAGATSIKLNLKKGSNVNGIIKYYFILVNEVKQEANAQKSSLECFKEHLKDGVPTSGKSSTSSYIAAVVDRDHFQETFALGNGTNSFVPSTKFENSNLIADTKYQISVIAWIEKEKFSASPWLEVKTNKPLHATTIILIITMIILFVAILLVCIYCVRNGYMHSVTKYIRRQRTKSQPGVYNPGFTLDEVVHSPAAVPIKTSNFAAYVQNLVKDGRYLYSEEFKFIQNAAQSGSYTSEHSNHPINRDKNRYNNIVAYDHTRVKLYPIEGVPESDYINANYIDGYNHQAAYIATQGPLEATCDHFWRMCWEQNVSTIVMLTGMEENGRIKCHQYWPEHGSINYGSTTVRLTEAIVLPTCEIRTFVLEHEDFPQEEKFIRQFYFISWRDHGTPYAHELLAFIRRVNSSITPSSAPIVVHCSAGVGRTGTYITLDVNLKRIKVEDHIEIYNYLQHIRSQRNFMVQTEQQYIFIHNALLEYLTAGETEIEVRELRDYVKHLQQPVENSGSGGELNIDQEFQKLNLFDPSTKKTMHAANAPCNKSKNRFLNVLAYDDTRVLLRMQNMQGSDYINANYIHGYSQVKQFIATQAPLPNTIPAFWRMIWEHNSTTIVCLSQETEGGKVKIHRYWPSIETVMHGPLMIEKNGPDQKFSDFVVRELKVAHTTEGHSRTIKHFQYVGWPDNSYPDSGAGMVELIGHVQRWHQQNNFGNIIVHCSAGVGRTGVFIGLCNMIERVRVEGVIDVFQTVRILRNQRPAMVQTKQEYMYLYLAFQDFLASFDIYQNFF